MRVTFLGWLVAAALFCTVGSTSLGAQTRSRARRSTATGQPAELVAVHATGSSRYTEAEIASATGLTVGATVSPADFKGAADKLVASGAFMEVRYRFEPTGKGYSVTFQLQDAEKFLPVTFDNFVWFTDQELTDAVRKRVPLFKGEVPVTSGMLDEVSDALQAILNDRGINGTVRFQQEDGGSGTATQTTNRATDNNQDELTGGVFSVQGVDVRVKELQFPGAAESDKAELQAAAASLLKMPYHRSAVRDFEERILQPMYAKRGYLKARFENPVLQVVKQDPQAPEIALSIPAHPGPQYTVTDVRWTGIRAFTADELLQVVTLRPGQLANSTQIEADAEKVKQLYGSKGYLRIQTTILPVLDDAQHTVSYRVAVQEGDQYRLRDVDINSRALTQDVITRLREAWRLREGEPYDTRYEAEYVKSIGPALPPNVSVEVSKQIDDEAKLVDISLDFIVHQDKVVRDGVK